MTYAQNLVTEMRHRMSNDLALVVGMLETDRKNAFLTADEALDDAVGALMSLTLYYRRLCEMSDDVDLLDLSRHLEGVIAGLRRAYLNRLGIDIECRLATMLVPPPAARDIGLIVAELIANAAKHAFAEQRGHITVELLDSNEDLVCRVRDNGAGWSGAACETGGLGVAGRLAARLGGALKAMPGPPGGGAVFELRFPSRAA